MSVRLSYVDELPAAQEHDATRPSRLHATGARARRRPPVSEPRRGGRQRRGTAVRRRDGGPGAASDTLAARPGQVPRGPWNSPAQRARPVRTAARSVSRSSMSGVVTRT